MIEAQEYLDRLWQDCTREAPSELWFKTKAYVRLSRSGTIRLQRYGGEGNNYAREHERDRGTITVMQNVGLIDVIWTLKTIDLYPAKNGVDWLAVMDKMDDPNVGEPHPAYKNNPLHGAF